MKKFTGFVLLIVLALSMTAIVSANSAEQDIALIGSDGFLCADGSRNHEAEPELIREVLTSAFNGEPFIAEFNPETGKILFYEMCGELLDWYHYNQTEDCFWHLVRVNYVATNPIFSRTGELIRRNAVVYDYLTRNVYEYDFYGNVTVTSFYNRMRTLYTYDEYGNEVEVALNHAEFMELRERERSGDKWSYDYHELTATAIQPRFPGWVVWNDIHNAPPSSNPIMGPPIGGRWFTSPSTAVSFIDINILQAPPNNMILHAFFTNQAGTNSRERRNFRSRAMMDVYFPRQPYQARMVAEMPGMGGSWPILTQLYFS